MTELSSAIVPSASIRKEFDGTISAFSSNDELVMCFGRPIVKAWIEVKTIQDTITTLEELLPELTQHNQTTIMGLLATYRTLLDFHQKAHEEVVTAAPTADDQLAYLVAYAAAMQLI